MARSRAKIDMSPGSDWWATMHACMTSVRTTSVYSIGWYQVELLYRQGNIQRYIQNLIAVYLPAKLILNIVVNGRSDKNNTSQIRLVQLDDTWRSILYSIGLNYRFQIHLTRYRD